MKFDSRRRQHCRHYFRFQFISCCLRNRRHFEDDDDDDDGDNNADNDCIPKWSQRMKVRTKEENRNFKKWIVCVVTIVRLVECWI